MKINRQRALQSAGDVFASVHIFIALRMTRTYGNQPTCT